MNCHEDTNDDDDEKAKEVEAFDCGHFDFHKRKKKEKKENYARGFI